MFTLDATISISFWIAGCHQQQRQQQQEKAMANLLFSTQKLTLEFQMNLWSV